MEPHHIAPSDRPATVGVSPDPFFSDPSQRPKRGCRAAPTPEVWDEARRRFLSGESATSVCDDLGIARTSFHERKAAEGWRRVDQRPLIYDFSELADIDLPLEPHELREIAWRHAARAICHGDRMGSRTWLRTVRELEAIQDRDDRIEEARVAELDEEAAALCDALRREGVDPAQVPLLRDDDEAPAWDYAFQRNLDLNRALAEARGEPDPYPGRPRPGGEVATDAAPPALGFEPPDGPNGADADGERVEEVRERTDAMPIEVATDSSDSSDSVFVDTTLPAWDIESRLGDVLPGPSSVAARPPRPGPGPGGAA